ncbi:hypothetical protein BU24DRAFT_494600 [Aaosphaeria arxii CBS 175.79]|uniref:Myb-like domain-containing protein n=1 Tax=Aaosphaeria arxii CBS 175.79 TaxID=1450172 RepID=A0A6A5XJZ9_9PLEO|nr:uncharacterized protein BU24DRAFT_494600 [Aaosphaeria arxii CBS 175.79]KAF2012634.1 hypothetical protein BU24DRAFT_494600 [Aaosphaeria arxii CBS 175.79]
MSTNQTFADNEPTMKSKQDFNFNSQARTSASGSEYQDSPPPLPRAGSKRPAEDMEPDVQHHANGRKKRDPRPKLLKWDEPCWAQIVIALVSECGKDDVEIPWDRVAKVLGCTASALQQAILKNRKKLAEKGFIVDSLKMTWKKGKQTLSFDDTTREPGVDEATQTNFVTLQSSYGNGSKRRKLTPAAPEAHHGQPSRQSEAQSPNADGVGLSHSVHPDNGHVFMIGESHYFQPKMIFGHPNTIGFIQPISINSYHEFNNNAKSVSSHSDATTPSGSQSSFTSPPSFGSSHGIDDGFTVSGSELNASDDDGNGYTSPGSQMGTSDVSDNSHFTLGSQMGTSEASDNGLSTPGLPTPGFQMGASDVSDNGLFNLGFQMGSSDVSDNGRFNLGYQMGASDVSENGLFNLGFQMGPSDVSENGFFNLGFQMGTSDVSENGLSTLGNQMATGQNAQQDNSTMTHQPQVRDYGHTQVKRNHDAAFPESAAGLYPGRQSQDFGQESMQPASPNKRQVQEIPGYFPTPAPTQDPAPVLAGLDVNGEDLDLSSFEKDLDILFGSANTGVGATSPPPPPPPPPPEPESESEFDFGEFLVFPYDES